MIKVKHKKPGRPRAKLAKAAKFLERLANDPKFKKCTEDLIMEILISGHVTQKRRIEILKKHGLIE